MVTADFDAYFDTQRLIDQLWQSPAAWNRKSMLNIANMAWFSSDRTIGEYAADVWDVPVEPPKKT
jgi:starch phosphorylase